mmetsp:Transcript_5859/g.6742  ORF Transcript_5859/g.6742 Transcript_5859/m.6742 type:complete len:177 (-) Transcript_5859:216-746(-)
MVVKHFQVIGRKQPTENEPTPQLYRMQIFAPNEVTARSRFWYFLHQYKKMKKTTGEILSVNQIFEKKSLKVKNFYISLRYNSRSGTHNMYKEYRDTTLCGAVEQMYAEMAGRHRARKESIQIIKTGTVGAKELRRPINIQFVDAGIKFPIQNRRPRASSRKYVKKFSATRPTTFAR